jgi:uncharacterized delta-60 repeat protein
MDNSFSQDGKQNTDFSAYEDLGMSVKVSQDGKIIVGGYSGKASVKDNDFALASYNTDGTLNNAFSGNGKVNTSIDAGSEDYCNSIVIQADGSIVAGGYYLNSEAQYDFALIKYSSNGTIDNSFGYSGKVITDFLNTDDYGQSLVIGGDGKLVVAGESNGDFAVARYNLTATELMNVVQKIKPTQPILMQVFPNPFSCEADIMYSLSKDGPIEISLLEVSGKKIKTIANDKFSKGIHQFVLSKGNLAPGVYFLEITTDHEQVSRKVLIE